MKFIWTPEAVAMLATHPRLGKKGAVTGTRELIPHENYRVIYEIESDTIWLLAIVHSSRSWPL
jgi:plasmid stabilization system protein ParE